MNVVALYGRLAKDVEAGATQGGTPVAKTTIAVSAGKDKTDFIPITAYGKTAEMLAQYFNKGNRIAVNGRLNTYKYEKDGQTRYGYDVVLDRVHFVETASESKQSGAVDNSAQTTIYEQDDIPF